MAHLLKITHGVDDKITSVDDGVKGIKVGQSLLEHRAQVNAFAVVGGSELLCTSHRYGDISKSGGCYSNKVLT